MIAIVKPGRMFYNMVQEEFASMGVYLNSRAAWPFSGRRDMRSIGTGIR